MHILAGWPLLLGAALLFAVMYAIGTRVKP